MRKPVWSESLPIAGTTTNTAPVTTENGPVFRVIAAADAYVAIGKTPNAAVEPRVLVVAGVPLTIYVEAGDKLAWVPTEEVAE